MANLKSLRTRIGSIKSTQKITAAMKLVAGVKFRKSEEEARGGRHYADALRESIEYLCSCGNSLEKKYPLLTGQAKIIRSMTIVVYASDKGLCGSFNDRVAKEAVSRIQSFLTTGVRVNAVCIGTKIMNYLRKRLPEIRVDGYPSNFFSQTDNLKSFSKQLLARFYANDLDQIFLLYNHFYSAINAELRFVQAVPAISSLQDKKSAAADAVSRQIPFFGTSEERFVTALAEHNFLLQLRQAGKESIACENSTRMTAMDNATKNAQDMVEKLVLTYNRTRQAVVTGELIEIISGAEAL
ncbi:MAG: ATP synthase F1 subunit gamma [Holosporales bacterium]|jgi:F-type H+-transporting ATPase subunit gamma|nr:ATP synthase F1 subunit gamma [Holosporales bacterium]